MTKREYVVLSVKNRSSTDVLGEIKSNTLSANTKIEARVEVLGAGEAQSLQNEKETLHVARSMRMRLGKRMLTPTAEIQATAESTWGVKAVGALTSPFKGTGVKVAVLDSGIRREHVAFGHLAAAKLIEKDFTGDGNGDIDGHGTHCAGTIFGGTVDGKRIGVAPGIDTALIGKVIDKNGVGSTRAVVDGILWAAKEGANIISMSLGFDFAGFVAELVLEEGLDVTEATSIVLSAYRENIELFNSVAALAMSQALGGRTLLIAAAGNESKRPRFEVATAPPAASDGFISVGALKRGANGFEVASFSNAGPKVAGPGVGIESARHDGEKNELVAFDGTSMATPHVAGVAALWWEQLLKNNGNAKIHHLENKLLGTAQTAGVAADQALDNVGTGMVFAPQS